MFEIENPEIPEIPEIGASHVGAIGAAGGVLIAIDIQERYLFWVFFTNLEYLSIGWIAAHPPVASADRYVPDRYVPDTG